MKIYYTIYTVRSTCRRDKEKELIKELKLVLIS